MTTTTILFETIAAAQKAYNTLQPIIDLDLDFNAVTYDAIDEPWVTWLIQDSYCQSGAKKIFNPSLNKRVILLVDDDPNLLLIAADYFDFRGLQPITAESAEEAWDYYCNVKPDVIVSGIAMQSLDCGYRLLQQVREDDRYQPFIFLSSQITIPGKTERAIELGANACFAKPFDIEELFSAIAQFFSKTFIVKFLS